MNASACLGIVFALALLSPGAEPAGFRFVAPTVGDVTAQVKVTTRRDDQLVVVAFHDSRRATLLELRFLQWEMAGGDVLFQSCTVEGLPIPTVIVAHWAGRADGITVDLVGVGEIGGRLQRLFAFYNQDIADAVCLVPAAVGVPPRLVLAQFTDGEYCSMCWPKRFRASTYDWNGNRFQLRSKAYTKRLHADWSSALAELRLPSGKEVLQSTASPCD